MNLLRCAAVVILACIPVFCAAQAVDGTAPMSTGKRDSRALIRLLREKDGLHKAAVANGGKFVIRTTFRLPYVDPNSVEDLIADSVLIVRGKVLGNRCKLNSDGNTIRTDYEIAVGSVLYGQPKTNTITVSLPGGKVAFGDGSTGEMVVSSYRKMINGTTVILFLAQAGGERFRPVDGPDGIFEIRAERVFPYANPGSELAPRYTDFAEQAFLVDVERAVQERKEKAPRATKN